MIRRKKRPAMSVPTDSMGDIAFLLIIFFMLASSFMKTANVEAVSPTASDIETKDAPLVNVTVDKDGRIWTQGQEVSKDQLKIILQEQADLLREHPVHVLVDKSQLREVYMPVIEAVSEAGVKMILTGEPED